MKFRTFEEWLEIADLKKEDCPDCRGTGHIRSNDCPNCSGTGELSYLPLYREQLAKDKKVYEGYLKLRHLHHSV